MKIGTVVRVIDDEFPEMIGAVGKISSFSNDGTAAVVDFKSISVWCSTRNLEEL